MENFEKILDLSVFDELSEQEAINYIIAKYWEEVAKEVIKTLNLNSK